tara:strand:- start:49 stop:342 length:294 start_codon:yes stop_codon:yes gene_type:complete
MAKKQLKPVAAALGTTFAVTLAASPLANAAENPFSVTTFESGYMVSGEHGAEGKCGGEKSDAEGKCGGEKAEGEGKCGGDKTESEGKCGEGKCGGDK